jgi:hypothetical protein
MTDTPTPDLAAELQGERRLEERYVVHWPLLISWTTPSGVAVAHGRTLNLSFGGAHVVVDHNFALGENVACRLSVQPWHGNSSMFDIDMFAKVLHSNYSAKSDGFDVGLQFTAFDGNGKERFAQVVQALQKGVSIASAKIVHGGS